MTKLNLKIIKVTQNFQVIWLFKNIIVHKLNYYQTFTLVIIKFNIFNVLFMAVLFTLQKQKF